ncbi:hypothetical protein, partial [Lentibacillus persicus]
TLQRSIFGLHLMDMPDEGMFGYNPERHGRVSDHEFCGDGKTRDYSKIFHHLPGKVRVVILHCIGKFRNEMDAMKSMRELQSNP